MKKSFLHNILCLVAYTYLVSVCIIIIVMLVYGPYLQQMVDYGEAEELGILTIQILLSSLLVLHLAGIYLMFEVQRFKRWAWYGMVWISLGIVLVEYLTNREINLIRSVANILVLIGLFTGVVSKKNIVAE